MKIANIKENDIADGPGVRVSIFVTGCTHRCKGCFNKELWDFGSYGLTLRPSASDVILKHMCSPIYISGLSVLGGEPMEPENQRDLLPFLKEFKKLYPHKTIWLYSGYTFEELSGKVPSRGRCEATDDILNLVDVLVDGEFVQELCDISLQFRGSSNQRIIDIPKTMQSGEVILWVDSASQFLQHP